MYFCVKFTGARGGGSVRAQLGDDGSDGFVAACRGGTLVAPFVNGQREQDTEDNQDGFNEDSRQPCRPLAERRQGVGFHAVILLEGVGEDARERGRV